MKLANFGPRSVVKEAWRVLKTQPKYIALFLLAIAVIKVGGGSVTQLFEDQGWTAASSLWGVITAVIDMYVGILTINVTLKLIRGVPMTLAETWFTDKQVMVQYLFVSIVYGLLVMAGYILLIVPGVILQVTYSLATFLVIDKQMRMKEALGESRRLTTGNRWKIIEIGLVLMLINIAGALAIGLGLLITVPLTMIATAVIYTQLSAEEGGAFVKKEIPASPVKPVAVPAKPVIAPVTEKTPVAEPSDEMNQYQI